MSGSSAIGMVGESMQNLLSNEMSFAPDVKVTLLAPDESGSEKRINLFLYKVLEHAILKNADWQVKPGDPNKLMPPPLSLTLFYLMTPYAANDTQTGNSVAHEILGDAMRVFYEHPVIPQSYLADGLKNAREEIRIVQDSADLEELSRIWTSFTRPFRLSIVYQVSVVQIDPLPEQERPLARRVRTVGAPRVEAPFLPPVVHAVSPLSGAAGSVLTFRGEHLAGWRAYVRLLGNLINSGAENGLKLGEDQFAVTLPPTLAPGFYELRVDISHLFRRVFFVEVT